MKTASEVCRFVTATFRAAAVGLALMAALSALGGDTQMPLLKTRTGSYTNVTVTGISKTDVYLTHSRGMTNIKIQELDPESIATLGLASSTTPTSAGVKNQPSGKGDASTNTTAATTTFSLPDIASQFNGKMPASLAMLQGLPSIRLSTGMVAGILGLILVAYLFICYCLKLICEKTGQKPGPMIWFPFLQMFPLLRAANMPGWWSVGFVLPFLNIVAHIVWAFKIAQARGKSALTAIGLLLPITSLFALLYLAFSSGGAQEEEEIIRGETPLPPLFAEA